MRPYFAMLINLIFTLNIVNISWPKLGYNILPQITGSHPLHSEI